MLKTIERNPLKERPDWQHREQRRSEISRISIQDHLKAIKVKISIASLLQVLTTSDVASSHNERCCKFSQWAMQVLTTSNASSHYGNKPQMLNSGYIIYYVIQNAHIKFLTSLSNENISIILLKWTNFTEV